MKSWSIIFEANGQRRAFTKHDVVVLSCIDESLHGWFEREHEGVRAAGELRKARRLRACVEDGAKDASLRIPDQNQTGIVAVGILLSCRVKLVQAIAIFASLKDQLWNADAHVGWNHHPEVRVSLVVNE